MDSTTFVVIAYGVFWAAVLGYVALLALRHKRLAADLEELKKKLDP